MYLLQYVFNTPFTCTPQYSLMYEGCGLQDYPKLWFTHWCHLVCSLFVLCITLSTHHFSHEEVELLHFEPTTNEEVNNYIHFIIRSQ